MPLKYRIHQVIEMSKAVRPYDRSYRYMGCLQVYLTRTVCIYTHIPTLPLSPSFSVNWVVGIPRLYCTRYMHANIRVQYSTARLNKTHWKALRLQCFRSTVVRKRTMTMVRRAKFEYLRLCARNKNHIRKIRLKCCCLH